MKCVICGKLFKSKEFEPFCSNRCKLIDLGHWFNEDYLVDNEKVKKITGQIYEKGIDTIRESPDSSVGRAED